MARSALAVVGTERPTLEAFAVFFQAHGILAIATRHVTSKPDNLDLEGTSVAVTSRFNGILPLHLVRLVIVAVLAVAALAVA